MVREERDVAASAEQVWSVLADPWSYASWVVGSSRIRGTDGAWPAAGSRLHHSVGSWPLLLDDHTEVLESLPTTRLVLQAHGWPMGEARVELTLEPRAERCRVAMGEQPVSGPGAWVHNPVLDLVLHGRVRESLTRLALVAEGRAAARRPG